VIRRWWLRFNALPVVHYSHEWNTKYPHQAGGFKINSSKLFLLINISDTPYLVSDVAHFYFRIQRFSDNALLPRVPGAPHGRGGVRYGWKKHDLPGNATKVIAFLKNMKYNRIWHRLLTPFDRLPKTITLYLTNMRIAITPSTIHPLISLYKNG
jgi:hypothetical protein